MPTESISVIPDDIIAILIRHYNQMHNYCSNPPPDFSIDTLARFHARSFGFIQKLQEMAQEAKQAAESSSSGATMSTIKSC